MPILGVVQLYWVGASHTGRYARLTSLGLNAMYAQAVQSVRPVESTVHDQRKHEGSIPYDGQSEDAVK